MSEPLSDDQLQMALGRFAALAHVLLHDPGAWLGRRPARPAAPARAGGAGARLLAAPGAAASLAVRVVRGREHPGSPGWAALPPAERSDWWITRIQTIAAPIAATPRLAGALADRLPLQGTLGSAAAGLAVCAVAREHGIDAPQDWVPLLGKVLFDRDLVRPSTLPSPADPSQAKAATHSHQGPVRRALHGLWRLARLLWGLPGYFDERPRGPLVWRGLGKLPLVGLPAGLLDERGAVRAAGEETTRLLQARAGEPGLSGTPRS
jgi:hypothetical protein